jgi:hypothetical protein
MELQCWKCGEKLEDIILPFSRREECRHCNADQHVCRLCTQYDPRVADSCREDRAEYIQDTERANFCDYFAPKTGAYIATDASDEQAARDKLAELFGEQTSTEPKQESQLSDSERALRQLNKLFDD